MAYKYATGSVQRGDIYDEDDAQGNTYIDWNEDAFGVVAGGTTNFVVSSSTVGIGTTSPTHEFEVHPDEDITAIIGCAFVGHSFNNDAATFGHYDRQGSHYAIYQNSSGLTILNTGASQAMYFRINNSTKMTLDSSGKLGIGTTSPTSTFEVSGSQAGNYAQSTGNLTFDETHYIVDYTGNGDATFTLPNVSGITGRVYHIISHNQSEEDVNLTVTGSGGQFQSPSFESGDQDSIRIAGNTPQSITVVSTGGNWFVLNDNRAQDHG